MLAQYGTRILTDKERETIKANKQKDKQYFNYIGTAIEKMKPKKSTLKIKEYKGV